MTENLLNVPIGVLSLEDITYQGSNDLNETKSKILEKGTAEKFKLTEGILEAVKSSIQKRLDDASEVLPSDSYVNMSSAPSFVKAPQSLDHNNFREVVRLSEHIPYFDLMNDAFNIEVIIEIDYLPSNDDTLRGLPPFEYGIRTYEEYTMKHANVKMNVIDGDLESIEKNIDFILDGIHDMFYTIFSDVSEEYQYALRGKTEETFQSLLQKFTGTNDVDSLEPEVIQDIYYLTLISYAVKFYRAREEYNRILGLKVEPQNILTTEEL